MRFFRYSVFTVTTLICALSSTSLLRATSIDTLLRIACPLQSDYTGILAETAYAASGDTVYQLFLSDFTREIGNYVVQPYCVRRWAKPYTVSVVCNGLAWSWKGSGRGVCFVKSDSSLFLFAKTDSTTITQFRLDQFEAVNEIPCYPALTFTPSEDGGALNIGGLWYDLVKRKYIDSLQTTRIWRDAQSVVNYHDSLKLFRSIQHPSGMDVYQIASRSGVSTIAPDTIPESFGYFYNVAWSDIWQTRSNPPVNSFSLYHRATKKVYRINSKDSIVSVWPHEYRAVVSYWTKSDSLICFDYLTNTRVLSLSVQLASVIMLDRSAHVVVLRNQELNLYSCADGRLQFKTQLQHLKAPSIARFLNDSMLVVDCGNEQNEGYVINIRSGASLLLSDIYKDASKSALCAMDYYAANSTLVVLNSANQVRRIQFESGQEKTPIPQLRNLKTVRWLDFVGKGRFLNIMDFASESSSIAQFDLSTGTLREKSYGSQMDVEDPHYSDFNEIYFVPIWRNNLRAVLLVDAISLDSIGVISRDGPVRLLDCATGTSIVALDRFEQSVEIYDVASQKTVATISTPDYLTSAKFCRQNDSLVVSMNGGTIGVVDLKRKECVVLTDSVFTDSRIGRVGDSGQFVSISEGLFDIKQRRLNSATKRESTVPVQWNGLYQHDSLFVRSIEDGVLLANPFTLQQSITLSPCYVYCHPDQQFQVRINRDGHADGQIVHGHDSVVHLIPNLSIKNDRNYSRSGHNGITISTFAWTKDASAFAIADSDNVVTIVRVQDLLASEVQDPASFDDTKTSIAQLVDRDEWPFSIDADADFLNDVVAVDIVGRESHLSFSKLSNEVVVTKLSELVNGLYLLRFEFQDGSVRLRRIVCSGLR